MKKISLLAALLLASLLPACSQPQQNHITGHIATQNAGFLGLATKNRISIEFNGYEVMTGYLNSQNNAELVGMFQNKPVSAKCGGAESINCVINYEGRSTQIIFGK